MTVNPDTRPLRLHRSTWSFVQRQASIIVRAYATYEPLKTFFYLALPFILVGLILFARLGILYLEGDVTRGSNIQSLILGATALLLGGLIFLFGILADRIGEDRRLMEEILYQIRTQQVGMEEMGGREEREGKGAREGRDVEELKELTPRNR